MDVMRSQSQPIPHGLLGNLGANPLLSNNNVTFRYALSPTSSKQTAPTPGQMIAVLPTGDNGQTSVANGYNVNQNGQLPSTKGQMTRGQMITSQVPAARATTGQIGVSNGMPMSGSRLSAGIPNFQQMSVPTSTNSSFVAAPSLAAPASGMNLVSNLVAFDLLQPGGNKTQQGSYSAACAERREKTGFAASPRTFQSPVLQQKNGLGNTLSTGLNRISQTAHSTRRGPFRENYFDPPVRHSSVGPLGTKQQLQMGNNQLQMGNSQQVLTNRSEDPTKSSYKQKKSSVAPFQQSTVNYQSGMNVQQNGIPVNEQMQNNQQLQRQQLQAQQMQTTNSQQSQQSQQSQRMSTVSNVSDTSALDRLQQKKSNYLEAPNRKQAALRSKSKEQQQLHHQSSQNLNSSQNLSSRRGSTRVLQSSLPPNRDSVSQNIQSQHTQSQRMSERSRIEPSNQSSRSHKPGIQQGMQRRNSGAVFLTASGVPRRTNIQPGTSPLSADDGISSSETTETSSEQVNTGTTTSNHEMQARQSRNQGQQQSFRNQGQQHSSRNQQQSRSQQNSIVPLTASMQSQQEQIIQRQMEAAMKEQQKSATQSQSSTQPSGGQLRMQHGGMQRSPSKTGLNQGNPKSVETMQGSAVDCLRGANAVDSLTGGMDKLQQAIQEELDRKNSAMLAAVENVRVEKKALAEEKKALTEENKKLTTYSDNLKDRVRRLEATLLNHESTRRQEKEKAEKVKSQLESVVKWFELETNMKCPSNDMRHVVVGKVSPSAPQPDYDARCAGGGSSSSYYKGSMPGTVSSQTRSTDDSVQNNADNNAQVEALTTELERKNREILELTARVKQSEYARRREIENRKSLESKNRMSMMQVLNVVQCLQQDLKHIKLDVEHFMKNMFSSFYSPSDTSNNALMASPSKMSPSKNSPQKRKNSPLSGSNPFVMMLAYLNEYRQRFLKESIDRRKLHNTLQELRGNIRVYCRVRPMLPVEAHYENCCRFPRDSVDEIGIYNEYTQTYKSWQFDRVFQEQTTNAEVFQGVRELVTSCMDGYNVCIFAYGPTGSGKTHSMEGTRDEPGIFRRTFEHLFRVAQERKSAKWRYDVNVGILEVYNEELRDLLDPSGVTKRQIRSGPNNVPYVPNLTLRHVTNVEEVQQVLAHGQAARKTGCTNLNEHSSRSHFMLQIFVDSVSPNGQELHAKLVLIDLAGSERLSKSGATGELQKEARAINKSLSALGDVIAARALKQSHVPFRNSTLTYLLQSCLSGDSKTLMLLQVSPACSDETACSLAFGARVNAVENKRIMY